MVQLITDRALDDGASSDAGPIGGDKAPSPAFLKLIGGFQLRVDDQVLDLGAKEQRLLGLIALNGKPVTRSQAAGLLWRDVPEGRATANLRSVLWRLRRALPPTLGFTGTHLQLPPTFTVDIQEAIHIARAVLDRTAPPTYGHTRQALAMSLYDDLLPDWPDDWLVTERERFRQLRLHTLEVLSRDLTAAGKYGMAIDVALTILQADPLRETAHHGLIEAYLAEGNYCEAIRQFNRYQKLAVDELGIEPSMRIQELVRDELSLVQCDCRSSVAGPSLGNSRV